MNRVIFFGTSNFAIPILESIYKNGNKIISIFTQPPNKSNRGLKLNKSPVHEFAERNNISVRTPTKILDDKKFISKLNFDLAVVVAYGQIIPESILELSRLGFINIHASILPKYRGAAPIQRSIINSEKTTGISIMKINKKLDSGPVCNQYKININQFDNNLTLSKKLSLLAAEKINQNINLIVSNKANFIDQNHDHATYASKINKNESKINWNNDAKNIDAKIKGLYPSPGAWFEHKNERYKILESEILYESGIPGHVLDDLLTIACNRNSIRIKTLQRQGKKPQATKDFLLGNRISKGTILNCD